MKKIKIDDIRNSLPKEKIKIDKMDIWVYYVIRPLSFFVTWLFLKVKINANLATIISMIIGVIGSFIFIPNGFFFHLIGAILINLWIVLDCVDGNIARFTKKTSTFGMFLDGLSGYFFTTFLYICIGLSVFFSQNYYEPFGEQKWVYLLLGSLTSIFTIFPRLVDHKAHTLFSNYTSETTNRKDYGLFHIIGLNIAGMAGLCNPLLLIAVIFNFTNIYLIFYFVIHGLIACYSLVKTIKSVPKDY